MGIDRSYWVYILASDIGGTLYIGVTNDLFAASTNIAPTWFRDLAGDMGFTDWCTMNNFGDIEFAIRREKRLKKWNRAWKIELIEKTNPNWTDLFPGIASP